jgi:hypothetical protein
MPVILATLEAEIRRIMGGGHPRQIVHETLVQKDKGHVFYLTTCGRQFQTQI